MLQLHYHIWLFASAAWWKTLIIRFISDPMRSRKKVEKAPKYYDVKQIYFQNEFENLASLSPQKSTIVYTHFQNHDWILDPNKTQKSLFFFACLKISAKHSLFLRLIIAILWFFLWKVLVVFRGRIFWWESSKLVIIAFLAMTAFVLWE